MPELLLAYSTTDGHTRHICERMAEVARAEGCPARVLPLSQCRADDVAAAGRFVIGASIRYGKHQPEVAQFVNAHLALIDARPNAFFSVNVVARKPGKDRPEGNPYLQKWLRTVRWKPQRLEVFAGRIDYPSLRWGDRTMIRFIMWMTRGPTDPKAVVEFTDWKRVEAFARELAGRTALAKAA
ncbi:MAG: menaquinone-dependent protoporphyrinogen IX dehydrogenase [Rubrivivax sp.]|nr:menaquinone-dependent protoporphyrinogen IX dehydrogenase [Rubrivivax sp.]